MVLGGIILYAVLGVIIRNDIRIPIKQAGFQWKVIRFFWFLWLTCGLEVGRENSSFPLSELHQTFHQKRCVFWALNMSIVLRCTRT